jgi:hypothetical protein
MVIVWQHGHISPHVVHNHSEALKHGVNGLTGKMSEILILHPVSREQARLHLIVLTMSYLELLPNLAHQVLFKVVSSSQAKQGGIMRLTRLPSDYNWATWPIYVASLPTGNSGGRCPHHSPLLNMGPALIPNDESGPGGIGFMVSPMHRLRSLASAPEF